MIKAGRRSEPFELTSPSKHKLNLIKLAFVTNMVNAFLAKENAPVDLRFDQPEEEVMKNINQSDPKFKQLMQQMVRRKAEFVDSEFERPNLDKDKKGRS